MVALRRKYADQALAASPQRLLLVGHSFIGNLGELSRDGTDACYDFISFGETSPRVLDLMKEPARVEHMHKQVTSIFEAIVDGRRSPIKHLPAVKADYDVLTAELSSRGWTSNDLQTFSDPRLLSRATPDKVCKMVQDWFIAQVSLKDRGAQGRLLAESLKPLVFG